MATFRFISLLAATAAVFILLTLLLYFVFKRKKLVKYVPAAGALLFAVYNIILMYTVQYTGFEDIARLIYAIILLTGFAAGGLCGLFLDLMLPRLGKNKV